MRAFFLTLVMAIMILAPGDAQISFSILGGVSPQASPYSAPLLVNRSLPHDEFQLSLHEVEMQYYIGIAGRVELQAPFFTEFGVIYTQRKSKYNLLYTMIDHEHPEPLYQKKEILNQVQLPLSIGATMGMVEITSGLMAKYVILEKDELHGLPGFSADAPSVKIGWHAGVGVNVLKSKFGIQFHGGFDRIGSGMYVNGQAIELMHVPGQVVFTLQQSM